MTDVNSFSDVFWMIRNDETDGMDTYLIKKEAEKYWEELRIAGEFTALLLECRVLDKGPNEQTKIE